MSLLREFRLRWRRLVHRSALDRDLEDEIRFHLEMRERQIAERGIDRGESQAVAARRFGNTTLYQENIRDMWSFTWLEGLWRDARYALRSLRKSPTFTVAAVLVLSLGIGSTTAIFSLVNAALLRGLPFADSNRLVELWGNVKRRNVERRGNSYPDYLDWKSQSSSFVGMAAFSDGWFTLNTTGDGERIPGEWISAGYFELLGVSTTAGRTFRYDEDRPGTVAHVVVISDGLWKRRFGGRADIIGTQFRLNQNLHTIVGVAPAWFHGLTDAAEVWCPFTASGPASDLLERGSRGFAALAKLKPGVTVAMAQAELDRISRNLEAAYPATNAKRGVEVAPLIGEAVGELRRPLLILMGAVMFVLLIACANVANLVLARSESRLGEMAIRASIGAGKSQIIRQLLVESLVLSSIGAGAGLLIGIWTMKVLVRLSPVNLPTFVTTSPDMAVVGFAAAVGILVGVVVGLLPAFRVAGGDVNVFLNRGSTRTAGGTGRSFRSSLVIVEIALSMTLLICSGLLIRTFRHITRLNPGFQADSLLTLMAALPPPAQTGGNRDVLTAREVLTRLRTLPSITAAAIGSDLPLGGDLNAAFYTAEGQPIVDAQIMPRAFVHRISPGFFETLRTQFIAGRDFNDVDIARGAGQVIVTRNLTDRFWPGQDPIGKRVKFGGPGSQNPWLEIIGVVQEMKYRGIPANPTADPDVFLPLPERQRNIAILLRSSTDPSSSSTAVRASIRALNPFILVYEIAPMEERVHRTIAPFEFAQWLMSIFAGLALILSVTGLYGVIAYTVRQRTREFGVRIALGATTRTIAGDVIRDGMLLTAAGVLCGAFAAAGFVRVIHTLLFDVSLTDPTLFITVSVLLGLASLGACYLPARRAARVDPVVALRYE